MNFKFNILNLTMLYIIPKCKYLSEFGGERGDWKWNKTTHIGQKVIIMIKGDSYTAKPEKNSFHARGIWYIRSDMEIMCPKILGISSLCCCQYYRSLMVVNIIWLTNIKFLYLTEETRYLQADSTTCLIYNHQTLTMTGFYLLHNVSSTTRYAYLKPIRIPNITLGCVEVHILIAQSVFRVLSCFFFFFKM